METENIKIKNVYQGANVRKLRQLVGMKQTTFGEMLGMNQQSVSCLGQKRVIESNTFQTGSSNVGMVENQRDNIVNHPVDQQMALNKEQASLYERMLAIEKEKNALLEELLKEKQVRVRCAELFTTTVFVVVKDSCRGNHLRSARSVSSANLVLYL